MLWQDVMMMLWQGDYCAVVSKVLQVCYDKVL